MKTMNNERKLQDVVPANTKQFTLDKANFDEVMSRLMDIGTAHADLVFITGPSGSGKDWLGAQLAGRSTDFAPVYIDAFGKRVDNKWVVTPPKVKQIISFAEKQWKKGMSVLVIGMSDNFIEVASALSEAHAATKEAWDKANPNTLGGLDGRSLFIQPVPSFRLWTSIMSAKHKSGTAKDHDSDWMSDYLRKSKLSRSEYFKYMKSKIELFSKVKATWHYYVFTDSQDPIGQGWHGVY